MDEGLVCAIGVSNFSIKKLTVGVYLDGIATELGCHRDNSKNITAKFYREGQIPAPKNPSQGGLERESPLDGQAALSPEYVHLVVIVAESC